jgi:futalosine hydrolase
MKILAVAATAAEIAPILSSLDRRSVSDGVPRMSTGRRGRHEIDVLVTGVGMVATAARCAAVLANASYDLALNAGVCGSFDPSLPVGSVVHVLRDRFAELGAEDGDAFLTVYDLKLLGENEFPFTGGMLENTAPPSSLALRALAAVNGITVNTVHGSAASIAAVVDRFQPQVESMEGAAFMYTCLMAGVPFAQVRAVSNIVERRNRAAWRIDAAIVNLGERTLAVLEEL